MNVRRRPPRRSTLALTLLLHLTTFPPYFASGLLAPGWAVLGLLVLWVVLGAAAYAVHRRWGAVSTLLPLLTIGLWFGAITLGEQLLGWTA